MDYATLIYRVLSGEATRQENILLQEWILESEGNRQEFEDIKLLRKHSLLSRDGKDAPGAFEAIRVRVTGYLRKRRQRRVMVSVLVLMGVVVVILSFWWHRL